MLLYLACADATGLDDTAAVVDDTSSEMGDDAEQARVDAAAPVGKWHDGIAYLTWTMGVRSGGDPIEYHCGGPAQIGRFGWVVIGQASCTGDFTQRGVIVGSIRGNSWIGMWGGDVRLHGEIDAFGMHARAWWEGSTAGNKIAGGVAGR